MIVPLEKPGTPEELIHFGVKGMQWGVRKQVENVSGAISKKKEQRAEKREQKAKGQEAQAARAQTTIDHIKANPSKTFFVQHHRDAQVKELEKYRDQRLKDAKDIREGHLTDHQKHVLIGAGVVAGILVAYGTYKFVDTGAAQQLLNRNIPLKKNDLLSRKMSSDSIMKEVVKPINPNFGAPGTKMNCRRATFAYEMRRRGYDVKATNSLSGSGQHPTSLLNAIDPKAKGKFGSLLDYGRELRDREANPSKAVGPMQSFMEKAHGLGKTPISDNNFHLLTPTAKSATIFEALSKNPEGARGELGMKWSFAGAHSMAWEIINGKPVIFDTQSGISYSQDAFEKMAGSMSQVASTRLDNADLNMNFLGKWIRNVK